MMADKTKYDTNPLDPDYARRTEDVWGAQRGSGESPSTEEICGATREVTRTSKEQARQEDHAEAPTRRYDHPPISATYPSVFIPPPQQAHPPAAYGAPSQVTATAAAPGPPTSRT